MRKMWWYVSGTRDGGPMTIVDRHTKEVRAVDSTMVFADELLIEMLHFAGKIQPKEHRIRAQRPS